MLLHERINRLWNVIASRVCVFFRVIICWSFKYVWVALAVKSSNHKYACKLWASLSKLSLYQASFLLLICWTRLVCLYVTLMEGYWYLLIDIRRFYFMLSACFSSAIAATELPHLTISACFINIATHTCRSKAFSFILHLYSRGKKKRYFSRKDGLIMKTIVFVLRVISFLHFIVKGEYLDNI